MSTYAWARILDDAATISIMNDAEFAEYWSALGKALRIASRAAAASRRGRLTPEATGVCASCHKPIYFLPEGRDLPGGGWHHMSGAEAFACKTSVIVPAPEGEQQ